MDIEQEIGKALSDPEIMSKVGSLLSQLGGGGGGEGEEPANNEKPKSNSPLGGMENNILSALSSTANDDRTRLLMAIKPFLSEKRAPYMDSAMTIMKLVNMGKIGKNLKLF